jgi:Leucine-rich repeat (LRR) protein
LANIFSGIDITTIIGLTIDLEMGLKSDSGMEEDLKSLDLSYNELNEIPVAPLKTLQSLVWANFHK